VRRFVTVCSVLAVACGGTSGMPSPSEPSQPSPPPAAAIRVLVLTATAGFRHDAIPVAQQVLADIAARNGFTLRATEDVRTITAVSLGSTDVLVFALTTGELPFDAGQRDAITAFVEQSGGGFIGVHSASDTLYEWPDYGRIVGAYFKEHPWTQEANVTVEDRTHAIDAGLPASFRLLEEYYTFRQNPRPSVHVLLSLDAPSVGASGDYPLAWTQTIGRGRSYYNALGHFDSTWRDARFQQQIANAIRWAAGRT
jgi:type 1 glutamine amidotransferase